MIERAPEGTIEGVDLCEPANSRLPFRRATGLGSAWTVLLFLAVGCGPKAAAEPTDDTSSSESGESGEASGSGAGSESGADSGVSPDLPEMPEPVSLECNNPQPYFNWLDQATDFVRCDDGFIHRPEASGCAIPDPPITACEADECGGPCDAAPNGFCVEDPDSVDFQGCECIYACESDGDCAEGEFCSCAGDVPRCMPSTCRTDADCGDGLCGLYFFGEFCSTSHSLSCLDADSECRPDTCAQIPGCFDAPVTPLCKGSSSGWFCETQLDCEIGTCG